MLILNFFHVFLKVRRTVLCSYNVETPCNVLMPHTDKPQITDMRYHSVRNFPSDIIDNSGVEVEKLENIYKLCSRLCSVAFFIFDDWQNWVQTKYGSVSLCCICQSDDFYTFFIFSSALLHWLGCRVDCGYRILFSFLCAKLDIQETIQISYDCPLSMIRMIIAY